MAPSHIAADDYEQLREVIASSLWRISPTLSATQREDVIQRSLLGLLQHRNRHEGVEHYSTSYLRQAAYHALIDELREANRRPEVELEESSVVLPSKKPGPDQWSLSQEIGQAIRECLRRLPAPRRLALSLVLLGHSVPEVAALGGWNAKKTENLVYRGRRDVKKCLQARGIEP